MTKRNALLLGVGAALVCLFGYDMDARDRTRPKDDGPDAFTARRTCERAVRERLRSPRTAQFSPGGETRLVTVVGEGNRVIGYVDAQNGFGAEIRSTYVCYQRTLGDGYTWTVDSIRLHER